MDPFSQQLVQLENRLNFLEDPFPGTPAFTPRAYEYKRGHLHKINETKSANESTDHNVLFMRAQPDMSMEAAILSGLSQSDQIITQGIEVFCSGVNCTWPEFDTLGVCYTCEDLDDQLRRVSDFGDVWKFMQNPDHDNLQIQKENATAVVLPSGHFLPNLNGCLTTESALKEGCEWPVNGGDPVRVPNYLATTYGTSNPNETTALRHLDTMIWAMSVLYVDEEQRMSGYIPPSDREAKNPHFEGTDDPIREDPDANFDRWPDSPVKATECALYYCVQTVKELFEDNKLMEVERLSNEVALKPGSWKPRNEEDYAPENISPTPESLEFHERYAALDMTDLVFHYPTRPNDDDFAPDEQKEFSLSHDAIMSISGFFQDKLRKSWENDTEFMDLVRERVPNATVLTNGRIKSPNAYEPQALEGIWGKYGQTGWHFEDIARSMTFDMRNNGGKKLDPNSDIYMDQNGHDNPKFGLTGEVATVYRMEWQWIALHGVIVVFGVIFCLSTMLNAKRDSRERLVWKNHSLATMKQGADAGHVLGGATTLRDLEERARRETIAMPLLQKDKTPSSKNSEAVSSDANEEEASHSER